MRKFESLFYKINTFWWKTATCIGLQVEQIFSVNIINIYFQFWGWLLRILFFFFFVISESSSSRGKNSFEIIFVACTSVCMSSKSVSQILKILFQTGDINIFALHGVFYSWYVQLKSSFPDEKTSALKSETHFSREAIDN